MSWAARRNFRGKKGRSVTVEAVAIQQALHQTLDAAPKILDDQISFLLIDPTRRPISLDSQGRTLRGVKALKESPGRVRFLSPEEMERLLDACATVPLLEAFVTVAINTGVRTNEILSLTRTSVDWTNGIGNLAVTKTGTSRHIPLNAAAMAALRSLPKRLDGKLFPFTPVQISIAFVRAAKRGGVEEFRLHDCRHTFASYQAMAGTQGRGLQALLGHKDGRMTTRYAHLSDEYLRNAVDSVVLGRGRAVAAR